MADRFVKLVQPQYAEDDTGHTIAKKSDAAFRIQTRTAWQNSWININDNVYLDWVQWNLAPTVSTAQLSFRYGNQFDPDFFTDPENNPAYPEIDARDLLRRFVRLTVFSETGQKLYFVGTIEIEGREHQGEFPWQFNLTQPGGYQTFLCYGMEYQLKMNPIRESWWFDQTASQFRTVQRGLTFNRDSRPNRTENRATYDRGGGELITSHLFNVDFVRGQAPQSRYWSSRDIVEYIVKWHPPRYGGDPGTAIPVKFGPLLSIPGADLNNPLETVLAKIPDDDRPVVETNGRTPLEILNDVLARQRFMSWWMEYYPTEESGFAQDEFVFWVETFTPGPIILPGWTIPKNDNTFDLDFSKDAGVNTTTKEDHTTVVDQVICQGARRRSCFTVAHNLTFMGVDRQFTFSQEWTAAELADWLSDVRTDAGYLALTDDDERGDYINRWRQRTEVANVFRKFALPEDKSYPLGDGTYTAYFPDIRILDTIPLLENIDYSGTQIGDGFAVFASQVDLVERRPFAAFLLTNKDGSQFFLQGDKVGHVNRYPTRGSEARRDWTCFVRTDKTGPYFYLDVTGYKQQAIAKTDYNPPAGRPERTGGGKIIEPGFTDWQDAVVTIAIEDDRHCEGVFPNVAAPANELRRYYIDAGQGYRLDWVASQTVVGVAGDGTPILSNGGFVRDDRQALQQMAELAYAFYSIPRRAVILEMDAQVAVDENGDPIANPNYPQFRRSYLGMVMDRIVYSDGRPTSFATFQPVATIVSRLQITWPGGTSTQQTVRVGRARMHLETDFAQFDPIHFSATRAAPARIRVNRGAPQPRRGIPARVPRNRGGRT